MADSPGAYMVQKGIEGFVYSIGDSMMNMNGANSTNAPGMIFDMITYTVDPFQYSFVKEWWGTFLILYVAIFVCMVCAGGAWVLMHNISPSTVQAINWQLTGQYSDNFEFKKWLSNISLGVAFPLLAFFGIYLILMINYIISSLITEKALSNVPLSPDNMVIYLVMAVTYFILSVIFAMRNLIIVLFTAGGLGLAALYLIDPLQGLVKHIFMYVLLIIFMQPILIFVGAAGVMFLQAIPEGLRFAFPSLYVALMIIEVGLAFMLMFGYRWISGLMSMAVRA